jgi:predicted TIM-barrel fold metal-dependent hydrolase
MGEMSTMGSKDVSGRDDCPSLESILKIDVHAHLFDDSPELVGMARRLNLRVVNICYCGNKPEWLVPAEDRAERLYRRYHPTFFFGSTFDLTRRNEPDYVNDVIAWLEASFEAGAVLTKIWKEVGMSLRTPSGAYLMPDDPLFDPIFEFLIDRGKPLMSHFADPIDAWLPLDPGSPHYGYYSKNQDWYMYGRDGAPSHAEILDACDHMLAKHPDLVMIAAHLGSMEHDLDGLAARLDRYPNLYVDVSGRTYTLFPQPRSRVRDFFTTYEDRILYGVDAGDFVPGRASSPEERCAIANEMEQAYRTDYRFYAGAGIQRLGQENIEGLALPVEILDKLYHANATRLMPTLGEP